MSGVTSRLDEGGGYGGRLCASRAAGFNRLERRSSFEVMDSRRSSRVWPRASWPAAACERPAGAPIRSERVDERGSFMARRPVSSPAAWTGAPCSRAVLVGGLAVLLSKPCKPPVRASTPHPCRRVDLALPCLGQPRPLAAGPRGVELAPRLAPEVLHVVVLLGDDQALNRCSTAHQLMELDLACKLYETP